MHDRASATAARVAAYRLGFAREPAPYGDATADEALARDVAGSVAVDADDPMGRYLRGRTAFFDRVVVRAGARGVPQVVSVGAGYDGRALRYAKPGTRWWEVDHPATQADKRERLQRLGIGAAHVTFLAHDLREAGLADGLVAAGYEPDSPAIMLCEGVIVYLSVATVGALLHELRSVATVGTRFAVSLRPERDSAGTSERRARFATTVAALGEPVRNDLTSSAAHDLLQETRWRPAELSERAHHAGFVVLTPAWSPPAPAAPVTRSGVGRFVERMLHRSGSENLAAHLSATYGVDVRTTEELDLGVHRVDLDDGVHWVARVFPAARPLARVQEEAELLAWLARRDVPCETPPVGGPVSLLDGQPVLVTGFLAGRVAPAAPRTFEVLGRLVGRLQELSADRAPAAARRPGGAWHHLLLDATPVEELAAARELLHDARHRVPAGEASAYAVLADALAEADDCSELPAGLVHPDPVPRNLVRVPARDLRLVDWTGAGVAPRVVSLGCLLWSAGGRAASVRAAMAGYGSAASLTQAEVERLPAAMRLRPLVLACWTFATGRGHLADVVARWQAELPRLAAGAALAAEAAGAP